MPNPFQQGGATAQKPTRYAPIFTNRFFTGLWTQRNPLRDAATPYLYEKFYAGARYDSLIGGSNVEISNRLTLVRRPGLSVYNSATFSAINRFYEFRQFTGSSETIQLIADTGTSGGVIYDATGPSTKATILTKGTGAGTAYFQGVGNTLYIGDGVDTQKYIKPAAWTANTWYTPGTLVTDSNNNIQQMVSARGSDINTLAYTSNVLTVTPSVPSANAFIVGQQFIPQGIGTKTFLNGVTFTVITKNAGTGVMTATPVNFTHANSGSAGDTGECYYVSPTLASNSGTSAPTWANSVGAYTVDGAGLHAGSGLVWVCKGAITTQNWGITAPPNSPTLTAPSTGITYWQPNLALTAPAILIDSNGNIQCAVGSGTTGTALPKWNAVVQGSVFSGSNVFTNDNTVIWSTSGPYNAQWQASFVPPVVASNYGYVIIDSNGNFQQATSGNTDFKTGTTAPAWATTLNTTTTDNHITWTCRGSAARAAFSGWEYGFSYVNSISGHVSTMSPASLSTGPVLGGNVVVTGPCSGDAQVDTVWIWRTTDGGATFFFCGTVANTGSTWTFTDNIPDTSLNELISAPINLANNPPPSGIIALSYHLNRVWGAVGNTVYFSQSPTSSVGVGAESFPPTNSFVFPSAVTRLHPVSVGLLVFTVSDVYIILGQGTSTSPLYPTPFLAGIGLLHYDAFGVNGSIIYIYTTDGRQLAFDPTSGISEVGFPIGDTLPGTISSSSAYVTWHSKSSIDTALYVSDGSTGWYRMNQTTAPEQGLMWHPFATLTGGCSAVQSVEVSPGVRQLLVGPASSGAILKRDTSVSQDNGSSFAANATIGSLVLAQPGQMAELDFITTDCKQIGSNVAVAVLLDEISGSFTTLTNHTNDPPDLVASASTFNTRWYMQQSSSLPTLCRHMQIKFTWPTENAANEMLDYAIFGAHLQEK